MRPPCEDVLLDLILNFFSSLLIGDGVYVYLMTVPEEGVWGIVADNTVSIGL